MRTVLHLLGITLAASALAQPVTVNASATDAHGVPIAGLTAPQFHIFVDGSEQTIQSFASGDGPASIGFVIDSSASMSDTIGSLKQAAARFVQASNPENEYCLIEVKNEPRLVLPFTRETARLAEAIDRMQAGGVTALFDGIHLAAGEMRHGRYERKALVVISDGGDNHSRYSEHETKRMISGIDYPIYAINAWEPPRTGSRTGIRRQYSGALETIAAPTGGRIVQARGEDKLAAAMDLISQQIRRFYVMTFTPTAAAAAPGHHKIRLTAGTKSDQLMKLSSRGGYYKD